MRKKQIALRITLSVDDHITVSEAAREIRTRINDVTGHYWDACEKAVRVRKIRRDIP